MMKQARNSNIEALNNIKIQILKNKGMTLMLRILNI